MADEITKNDVEEDLETTPQPKKKILKGHLPDSPREKKERTQAQILAFEKARASRESNLKKREADAKRLAEYDKLMLKQKIVEKAEKLKLKTMKKIETIDAISSDDDSDDEPPPIQKQKSKPKPEPVKPIPTPVSKPKIAFKFV